MAAEEDADAVLNRVFIYTTVGGVMFVAAGFVIALLLT